MLSGLLIFCRWEKEGAGFGCYTPRLTACNQLLISKVYSFPLNQQAYVPIKNSPLGTLKDKSSSLPSINTIIMLVIERQNILEHLVRVYQYVGMFYSSFTVVCF